jgi:hypothetical protein
MKVCIHDNMFEGRTQECIFDEFFDVEDCDDCPINELVTAYREKSNEIPRMVDSSTRY